MTVFPIHCRGILLATYALLAFGASQAMAQSPFTLSGSPPLQPPANMKQDWNDFLAGIDKAFDLIPDLADAKRDGDRSKLQDLTTQFTQIAGDTRPFAQKDKLNDCLPDNGATQ